MESTTSRGHGPQAFIDRLRAIEAEACDGRAAAAADPSILDPCITQVLHLAEELLEERERLLSSGEARADGVFRRVAAEYRSQVREQAAEYSRAYGEIDRALAAWRAWTLGHVTAAPAAPEAPWRPQVLDTAS